MSRRVILILIVIMALVMTSLILVQTNSIMKALEIKEEQFNAQVNSALTKVVYQLEMDEASLLVDLAKDFTTPRNNGIFPGSIQQSTSGTLTIQSKILSYQYSQRTSGVIHSEEIAVDFGNEQTDKEESERGRPGEFPNAFDILHESDGFARKQYEARLDLRARMFELQTQAAILSQLPIEDRIGDVSTLGRSIKAELKRQGINLDFRYALKTFPQGKEQLVYGDKILTLTSRTTTKSSCSHMMISSNQTGFFYTFQNRKPIF